MNFLKGYLAYMGTYLAIYGGIIQTFKLLNVPQNSNWWIVIGLFAIYSGISIGLKVDDLFNK